MNNGNSPSTDQNRTCFAFYLAIAGLLGTLVLLLLLIFKTQWTATDIVAVVGVFTSVLGTLVGAFLGIQVGAADKEKERKERQYKDELLMITLMDLDPDKSARVRQAITEKRIPM